MIICVCPNPSIDSFEHLEGWDFKQPNRVRISQRFPGGKGTHVALGLKELGEQPLLFGFWGGATGQWIIQQLCKLNIETAGVELPDWNRACMTFLGPDQLNETEVLGTGPLTTTPKVQEFYTKFNSLLPKAKAVCFSGSWPPNQALYGYGEMIKMSKSKGVLTFLDASGELLKEAIMHHPYCIHVNLKEASEFCKTDDTSEMLQILSDHADIVALTAGKEGLFLTNGKETVHAVNHLDKIISAVGSGDSLMSGLIYATIHKYDLLKTATCAASCGAANCIREELGMFYKSDVNSLIDSCVSKNITKGINETL